MALLLTPFWLAIEFAWFEELLREFLQGRDRIGRGDPLRRHQHHQLVIRLVKVLALEECPQDGNVSEARDLGAVVGEAVVHQSRDHKALSVFDFKFGFCTAGAK